jgi:hypothetical protein
MKMRNVSSVLFLLILVLSTSACNRSIVDTPQDTMVFPDNPKNVTIHSGGPCEPTICISPIDKNIVIGGSVYDNFYLSKDGGNTWKVSKLTSSFGVFGDPVTIIDTKGKFYFAHLSDPTGKAYGSPEFLDRIVVQTSEDGVTFTDGTFPKTNHNKDHDKHWLAVNPSDNAILMSWTEFDKYGSSESTCMSRILFSVSYDQAKTWTEALPISELEGDCVDDDSTTEGAVPAVGIDGTYYVVWAYKDKIYLDQSKDRGKTWLKNDQAIANQPGGWTFDIPGISRCNGMPVIKVDHSNGKNRGNIYISWADQSAGKDDTDIWLISSSDNGKTWTKPNRVNDDGKGHQQFFSWMDIDQSNGNIYLVFYDRRAYMDNNTDVYIAYSQDGGASFINKKISESPFIPDDKIFFGDYNDISASHGSIRPIWTRMEKGKLSVHTAVIDVK